MLIAEFLELQKKGHNFTSLAHATDYRIGVELNGVRYYPSVEWGQRNISQSSKLYLKATPFDGGVGATPMGYNSKLKILVEKCEIVLHDFLRKHPQYDKWGIIKSN